MILEDLEAAIDAAEAEDEESGQVTSDAKSMRQLLMASRESLSRSRLSLYDSKVSPDDIEFVHGVHLIPLQDSIEYNARAGCVLLIDKLLSCRFCNVV